MDTFQAISRRASVREYSNKPIPRDLLEKLIDAGRRAPTARCVEPWEFIIITDKKMLSKIADIVAPNGAFIREAAAAIVTVCQDTKYYLEDGCAATENMLIEAAELGLGGCWIAGDKKPYCSEMLSLLATPEGLKLVSIISLGWPKKEYTQRKNRQLKDVIHWEKF